MKIFVKTLKGSHFGIEVNPDDTVTNVKKNIETVQGSDVYPAGLQMLIHQGKVLKDETTLKENNVADRSFVVIMLSKSKPSSSGAATVSVTPSSTPQPVSNTSQPTQPVTAASSPAPSVVPVQSAPEAASIPTPTPVSTDVYGQAASNLVAGTTLEVTVQQILDMGGGIWDRDTVVRALRAAFNNPERAVEYLYSGIPEQSEAPPVAQPQASAQPVNPLKQAAQPAAAAAAAAADPGPNANPLDLFPQGLPNMGANAGAGNLEFLRNSPQFQALRAMVQANPQILQPMLQELGKQNQNPQLVRMIQEHQADFLRLINEPVEGEGNILGQLGEAMPQAVPEEREAIERRILMGSVEEKLDNHLLILYASQTGNAVDAAERLGREAERRGCPSVSVLSIDEIQPSDLPKKEAVIFVVSTTGQGETPDSMKGFWTFLLQKNFSREWLEGVHYAVFGLGDSSYQKYNFVAKRLDKRLSNLGAMAIVERGLGDDQHPSGYEGALDPWNSDLWNMLYQKNEKLLPKGPDLTQDVTLIDQPKLQIIFHVAEEGVPLLSTTTVFKDLEMQIERARSMSPGKFSGKNRPDCFLKMTKNHLLSRVDSGKDVRHLEFEAVSSSIYYEVGGVLEILPGQSPAAVDAFIQRCNLDPESYITVQPRDKENYGLLNHSSFPVKLKSFVELTMDIASASPRRYFFEVMSYFATAEHEKERLQYFASPEGRDDLYQYNQKERRTVLEVLEDFPSVQMPFEWLVQLVPPLKTRAFSISSSHSAHPNQAHLTVSIVSWTTPYKRKRAGLCSSWLASLDPQENVFIPAWFSKGSLPAPPPSLPLILIGPGTGCAPFHGFVEERALQTKTIPTAPIIFFFGCRNEKDDFLYRDFWLSHSQKNGVVSENKGGGFYVAFSRAQPQKVYVQHKIRENSKKIWSLLSQGAAVYVAGSANKMPSDVLSAFEEIVSAESGVSIEDAKRWIRTLEKAGKYHVEAWS